MDAAGFLAAIRAAPDDPAPRLIYADWLDERNDPRARLIRAEEEMRTLAPYSDGYWRVKPERDRLRESAPPDWLVVLRYERPWPVFSHGWPDDVRGRWRVVRAYASNWLGVALPDVGGSRWAVREVEKRVGRDLPSSLREYVAFDYDLDAHRGGRGRLDVRSNSATRVVTILSHVGHRFSIPWEALTHDDPAANLSRIIDTGDDSTGWADPQPLTELVIQLLTMEGRCCPDEIVLSNTHFRDLDEAGRELGGFVPVGRHRIAERPGVLLAVRGDASGASQSCKLTVAGLSRHDVPRFAWELRYGPGRASGMFDAGEARPDPAGQDADG